MINRNNKLYEKYPDLFPTQHETEADMSFASRGIECGEGWYELLDGMFGVIMAHYADLRFRDDKIQIPEVALVKEKFGTMRVFMGHTDAYVNGLVAMAESMSAHICEECGEKGVLHTKAWYKVRCHECYHTEDERAQKEWEKYRAK